MRLEERSLGEHKLEPNRRIVRLTTNTNEDVYREGKEASTVTALNILERK